MTDLTSMIGAVSLAIERHLRTQGLFHRCKPQCSVELTKYIRMFTEKEPGEKQLPTRKIAEAQKPCAHPEHNPPRHMVFRPGTYEHTCPACGFKTIFTVRGIIA